LGSSLPVCAWENQLLRSPVFQQPPCCSARPELHSLLRFSSPSGFSPEGLACHLSMQAPLLGISCRSAHMFQQSPHNPVRPTARVRVRVQGFAPSSRLAPPLAVRVYFTPQTPFGFTLQGFPLSESIHRFSLQTCRHAVAPVAALPLPSIAGPPAHHTQLLGRLRWCLGPTSRPCSP
jgi:hypothetical protein